MRSDAVQPFATSVRPEGGPRQRDRRRLRLLFWTAPIAALLVALGLWIIWLCVWTTVGNRAYERENYESAAAKYSITGDASHIFPEPWVAQLDLGTALAAQGDFESALPLLRSALSGVPKAVRDDSDAIAAFSYECTVRTNLSAAIEGTGDALAALGDERGAREKYREALEIVNPCEAGGGGKDAGQDQDDADSGDDGSPESDTSDSDEEDGRTGDKAGDRLREKLGEGQKNPEASEGAPGGADDQGDGRPGDGGGSDEQGPSDSKPTGGDSRRDQLEQKNREQAERDRRDKEMGGRGSGTGW